MPNFAPAPGSLPSNYPAGLIRSLELPDLTLLVRPILPQDASLLQDFVRGLSNHARRSRFWSTLHELPPRMLASLTYLDYRRHLGLIVLTTDDDVPRIVAEARYAAEIGQDAAEIAVVVADEFQRQGIGRRLLAIVQDEARGAGYRNQFCLVQQDNEAMCTLARTVGFIPGESGEPGIVRFEAD